MPGLEIGGKSPPKTIVPTPQWYCLLSLTSVPIILSALSPSPYFSLFPQLRHKLFPFFFSDFAVSCLENNLEKCYLGRICDGGRHFLPGKNRYCLGIVTFREFSQGRYMENPRFLVEICLKAGFSLKSGHFPQRKSVTIPNLPCL